MKTIKTILITAALITLPFAAIAAYTISEHTTCNTQAQDAIVVCVINK